jgi:hypothetical protein
MQGPRPHVVALAYSEGCLFDACVWPSGVRSTTAATAVRLCRRLIVQVAAQQPGFLRQAVALAKVPPLREPPNRLNKERRLIQGVGEECGSPHSSHAQSASDRAESPIVLELIVTR